MNSLISEISYILTARSWRLAVAESATGGLLGHLITQVPGSSTYFWGGVIAYANDIKVRLLNVQESSIIKWGAVSTHVALEMARGICESVQTEVGISITGIAGPGGATELKPVGLYYIGLCIPGEMRTWRHVFAGTRSENNYLAAETALQHLLLLLN
jgi:PncC family amidohydrolase